MKIKEVITPLAILDYFLPGVLNVNNSISNNDKKKSHDLILFLFVYQLFMTVFVMI